MTERPPVAEMKRLLFAKIAELRELEGRATKEHWNVIGDADIVDLLSIARNTFRASLDAHEAFLKQECGSCADTGLYEDGRHYEPQPCDCTARTETIQALYEALCGGEK